MLSLSRTRHVARKQADKCIAKVEFYKTKSQASYRNQAADNWQAWAEIWAAIEEQLEELTRRRFEAKVPYEELLD